MINRVVVADEAERDLDAAEAYWLKRDPALYRSLTVALEEAVAFLRQTPGAGSPTGNQRRKWRIGRTPYLLLYDVNDDALRLLRIRHQSENWRAP